MALSSVRSDGLVLDRLLDLYLDGDFPKEMLLERKKHLPPPAAIPRVQRQYEAGPSE
jgi:hypothetical protein